MASSVAVVLVKELFENIRRALQAEQLRTVEVISNVNGVLVLNRGPGDRHRLVLRRREHFGISAPK